MGAKADIDAALNGCAGGNRWRIVLGPSAAVGFLADLYHEGVLPVPAEGEPRLLPKSYRGFNIDTTEDFKGWSVEQTQGRAAGS